MIPDVIKMYNKKYVKREVDLKDVFNNPSLPRYEGTEIIRGLTIQHMESVDNSFVKDFTDELFADEVESLDLLALNIQRARDHGIDGYVKYR